MGVAGTNDFHAQEVARLQIRPNVKDAQISEYLFCFSFIAACWSVTTCRSLLHGPENYESQVH